jgi:hypothetical protein
MLSLEQSPKRGIHGDEVFFLEPYLLHSRGEQDVEGTPSVDEDMLDGGF